MTTTRSGAWEPAARSWWAVLAVVVALSLGTDLAIDFGGGYAGADPHRSTRLIRFFSYFTIQSNLLVLASTAPLVRAVHHDGRWWRWARLSALLGITITGVVYAVVLAPTDHPTGLRVFSNAGAHYVSPVMTLLGWLLFGPRPRITLGLIGQVLVWPVVWIAWTLAHGSVSHWYPYGFLDVDALGYPVALRNLLFVVLFAFVLLLGFRLADRSLPARPAPATAAASPLEA